MTVSEAGVAICMFGVVTELKDGSVLVLGVKGRRDDNNNGA